MKYYINKLIVLMLAVSFGCADGYLDTFPTDAVQEDKVFENTKNAMAALNGIHRALFIQYDSQGQPGEGGVMIMRDVLGEDLVLTTRGNGWFVGMSSWLVHIDETARDLRFVWRFYYKIIANANKLIENIDQAEGEQYERDEIKGQALAYRAWAHFNLVQLFAKRYDPAGANDQLGVPIVLKSITEGGPRNTVEEVYAQIHEDLDAAIALLGEDRNAKSHLNINVAKGIKARVLFTQGKYAAAAPLARAAREGYVLMNESQLFEGFNDVNNPEWIWGSFQQDDQQTYFASFFAYLSYNFSSTNIRTNPKAINNLLYAAIPASDYRKGLWDPTGQNIEVASNFRRFPYMNRKFKAQAGNSSVGDVPYMRAAEMILLEAESLARTGDDAGAAEVLFELAKARDPEYTLSTHKGQDLIDEIMIQRRVELWGEGFRFYDLKRLNLPLDRTGSNHVSSVVGGKFTEGSGTNNWQWKIPRAELNANTHMSQNP